MSTGVAARVWWIVSTMAICATARAQQPAGPAPVRVTPTAPTPGGAPGNIELEDIGRLVVTSGIGGHFADAACRKDDTLEPASIARVFEWVRRDLQTSNPAATLYDTGSLLAPNGVARFADAHDPAAVADLVSRLGYRALAFGEAELGSPRAPMISVVRALRKRGIPTLATNLYCSKKAQALCDVLVDASDGISLHRIGHDLVAFIAMIDPAAMKRISPDLAKGLRLSPVKETLINAVHEAKKLGATVVVASVDEGTEGAAAKQLALAGALPEDAKPDLLLSAGAGSEFLFARPLGFRPALVAAPPGGAARLRLRRNLQAKTLDVLVRPVPSADRPHPAIMRFIDRVGPQYCKRWGRRLAGGHLTKKIDGTGMLDLAAGAARVAADAELGLLPRSILDPSWHPATTEGLTASDVYVGVRYDEPLLVASVKGAWLEQLVKSKDKDRFVMPGLVVEDDNVKLNGRPIEARAQYRVVSVRRATVGLHALPAGPDWKPLPATMLRSALLRYLSRPRESDPRKALPDPALQPEWMFQTDIRGTFTGSSVRSPCSTSDTTSSCVYDDSQLQQASTATYGYHATLQADATAKTWGWQNVLDSRYHITTAVAAPSSEGDDQTSLRSTLRYRGWYERHSHFYEPQPFFEAYLETELTKPKDSAFRHFLVRPTAGVLFALTKELTFKVLGGFETEALAPDAKVVPGAGAQIVLAPWTVMHAGDRKLVLAAAADYFISDLGDVNKQALRGSLDAAYALNSTLSFGWNLNVFVVHKKGAAAGVALVNSAFIQIGWVGRAIRP